MKPFQMELELPFQRKVLLGLTLSIIGMFELGKINFGPNQHCLTKNCKSNRKADLLTTRTDNCGHSLESVNRHVQLKNNLAYWQQ